MKIKVLVGTIVYNGEGHVAGSPAFEIDDKEGKRLVELGVAESVAGRPTGGDKDSGKKD